jgi:streptogramin lyase
MFAPPGMSRFEDFSVSSTAPERITIYDDDRAVTLEATRGSDAAPAVEREFGRLRFPGGDVSAAGAHVYVLRGAGSLVRVEPDGAVERSPVCDTPLEMFWNDEQRRFTTICSPDDAARVEAVSTSADGSDRRVVAFTFRRGGYPEKPRFVHDPVSGRVAIVATNVIHVIDPSAGAEAYSVAAPGHIADVAIDDSSGDVFAAYSHADHGGGIERFNIRTGKPVTSSPRFAAGGIVLSTEALVLGNEMPAAPPARLDPPGIRSPAQLAPLADGSFLVRELLSPKIGRLRDGVYTQEDLLPQASMALVRGGDGNLWLLELSDGTGWRIARREPSGRITEFRIGNETPQNIVASGDGLYWIIGGNRSPKVGHLTYDGAMSVLNVALPKSADGFDFITGLAGDATGGFFVSLEQQVVHYDSRGKLTRTIPLRSSLFDGSPNLSSLDDGSIAVTFARKLLIIDRGGRQRIYFPALGLPEPPLPSPDDAPQAQVTANFPPSGPDCALKDIALGPRGSVWGICHNAIVDIEADGKIRRYHLPYEQSSPASLVRGSDGSMWFAETTQSRIGRITPAGELREIGI